MESNTERMERLLVLWLEVHQALQRARAGDADKNRLKEQPWQSRDAHVKEAWRKLTAPANLGLLEQWLQQSAEGLPADWAREALRSCREHAKDNARKDVSR